MKDRSISPFIVWVAWIAFAALLRFGPNAFPRMLETATIQSAGLGLQLFGTPANRSSTGTQADQKTIEQLQASQQQLVLQVAILQDKLKQSQNVPSIIPPDADPLLSAHTLPVRVLGARDANGAQGLQLLIAIGKQQGLVGEELVLKGPGVLIDRGQSAGVSADQLVSQGRGLFGRTQTVGRWTSLVQPVTDPNFRIAVRLVRNSPLGPVWGATGILAGTGDACVVHEVSATQPVAVGDYIYTQPQLSTSSEMIYCGQVTRADVGASDTHWTIQVEPAMDSETVPTELHVIQSRLNF